MSSGHCLYDAPHTTWGGSRAGGGAGAPVSSAQRRSLSERFAPGAWPSLPASSCPVGALPITVSRLANQGMWSDASSSLAQGPWAHTAGHDGALG